MAVSIDVTSIAIRPLYIKDVDATVKELARVLKKSPGVQGAADHPQTFVWVKRQSHPKEPRPSSSCAFPD